MNEQIGDPELIAGTLTNKTEIIETIDSVEADKVVEHKDELSGKRLANFANQVIKIGMLDSGELVAKITNQTKRN
jgi:hypothetical protein